MQGRSAGSARRQGWTQPATFGARFDRSSVRFLVCEWFEDVLRPMSPGIDRPLSLTIVRAVPQRGRCSPVNAQFVTLPARFGGPLSIRPGFSGKMEKDDHPVVCVRQSGDFDRVTAEFEPTAVLAGGPAKSGILLVVACQRDHTVATIRCARCCQHESDSVGILMQRTGNRPSPCKFLLTFRTAVSRIRPRKDSTNSQNLRWLRTSNI